MTQFTLPAAPAVAPGKRVVYPYSIVPGGVRDVHELQQAILRDPIVAHHYAGFQSKQAKVIEVTEPKLVHLSYRVRDKVYWTKKTISLHKGEKLISDGKIAARTRCANQVSEQAQGQTSPEEPPMALLERPMDGDGGTATQLPLPGKFADGLSTRPGLPPIGGGQGPLASGLFAPGVGGGYGPIASPGIPQNPHNFHPPQPVPGPPGPPPPPPPPPPAVPEPGTLLLVGSGVAGIYWRRRGKKKS